MGSTVQSRTAARKGSRGHTQSLDIVELLRIAREGDVATLRRSPYQTETGRCTECPRIGLVIVAGSFKFCAHCMVALLAPELGGA